MFFLYISIALLFYVLSMDLYVTIESRAIQNNGNIPPLCLILVKNAQYV